VARHVQLHVSEPKGLGPLRLWEYLLHVSTFATTRVALPTGVEPG
jgi:hypothetical protein